MDEYHLWSPWNTLDTSLQWIRRATPKPSTKYSIKLRNNLFPRLSMDRQFTLQDQALVLNKPWFFSRLPYPNIKSIRNKTHIIKPQPILLRGLDVVFGNLVTVRPPKQRGFLHVSENSAFSKVISHDHALSSEVKEPQIVTTIRLCRQLIHSCMLLCSIYKKCALVLQHSK
ncbi:FANCD2 opposite strand protein [Spea bombifrons]|uniref:FANCD2 opposite strand protein n=1 Tax=Spea bombifrons TaxID=233779 RepID=UPI00234B12A1|nr:FANCD2 opposite strand protein [Spea bombifrons]